MGSKTIDIEIITQEQIQERFWSKVDKSAGPDACWAWVGTKDQDGYGVFKIKGVMYRAHRLAFALSAGKTLVSGLVCHHCDNPECVNPKHLFIGDETSNMVDMIVKGRHAKSSLDNAKVLEIRRLHLSGESVSSLADKFEVTAKTICRVLTGERYASCDGETTNTSLRARGEGHTKAKLTEDTVRKIREINISGKHLQTDIAVMFGVSRSAVGSVLRGRTWKHVS